MPLTIVAILDQKGLHSNFALVPSYILTSRAFCCYTFLYAKPNHDWKIGKGCILVVVKGRAVRSRVNFT